MQAGQERTFCLERGKKGQRNSSQTLDDEEFQKLLLLHAGEFFSNYIYLFEKVEERRGGYGAGGQLFHTTQTKLKLVTCNL